MSSPRSALRLVIAGVIAIPLSIGVVGLFPAGSRLVPFGLSMAVVGSLTITGGWRARQALAAGTTRVGPGIAIAVTGLTIGVVAALVAVTALVSLLR